MLYSIKKINIQIGCVMNKLELVKEDFSRIPARWRYKYEFDSSQLLSDVDEQPFKYFGIEHDSVKEVLVDILVSEFKMQLNKEIFGEYRL